MESSPKEPPSGLLQLLGGQTPLLDVRAPAEFASGAVPGSINLPILTDDERAQVGIAYKQQGRDAATSLGHRLVSGSIKQARVQGWREAISAHPGMVVTCWRGGERSRIAQAWLAEAGCAIERVAGGYKALRKACLEILDAAAGDDKPWWVVAGQTGVRKTVLIRRLRNAIDLEHFAHHRGSAFGAHTSPQPAPATFENALACAYLGRSEPSLVLEDESRTIGKLALPPGWHERMQRAPLVVVEADLASRVEHIVDEYVITPLAQGAQSADLESRYRDALGRISRRLGGVTHQRIDKLMHAAFNGAADHHDWVQALLLDYYDPMYDYQLEKKAGRIVFRGSLEEVESYLQERNARAQ